MARENGRALLLVAASVAAIVAVALGLVLEVGRPYPGFFAALDGAVFPPEDPAVDLRFGDRVVAVDGRSPVELAAIVRTAPGPVRYEVERDRRRVEVAVAPRPFTWSLLLHRFALYFLVSALMLAAGLLVYLQKPAAWPNQAFLVYMCLWAVSNVAVPDAILSPGKWGANLVGVVGTLLPVHGWVFFLRYPANPAREAWLRAHRMPRRLYATALALALLFTLVFAVTYAVAPARLADGPLYRTSLAFQVSLALASFPIKILALLDTRRRAGSPLVNQQTGVLLVGIGLGLGLWLLLMLLPLAQVYPPPVDPQVGSALVLIYPAAIAYATVRYRLFDARVVIRRSLVYTVLAAVITGAYALLVASANLALAQAEVARSPWFSAAFVFAVALLFDPLRERVRRAVDRTFFRDRADHVRAVQDLARSMRTLLDLREIAARLTGTIERVMHARGVRLLTGDAADRAAGLGPALASAGALSRYQVAADPAFAPARAEALGAYEALGAEVIVPLRFQDEVHGLLVLGPKASEAPYTDEDLALLETLADQAAVAVANARAHHRVIDYACELERSLLIRTNLAKFVPRRVQELIEADPEARSLDKRETEVTVLFADISGYTRLSSTLAPEELDQMVERYFGTFLDEIVRHGGDVNETAGDGLMVIFHEGDHPRAAVAAARAIHRRAAELNAALTGRADPLAMHIGINTGPALLGATKIEGRAGTRWTYTASGLTTNIAARLAAHAQGGEIVISETTRARLPAGEPAEDLGLHRFKNVETPLRAYRLR